jgi:hypothetical protein
MILMSITKLEKMSKCSMIDDLDAVKKNVMKSIKLLKKGSIDATKTKEIMGMLQISKDTIYTVQTDLFNLRRAKSLFIKNDNNEDNRKDNDNINDSKKDYEEDPAYKTLRKQT